MAIQLNPKAKAHAKNLIEQGHVDKESSWSITTEEENALLGDNNWSEYGQWFLGINEDEPSETKAHYRYPVGKADKIYRSALIAIRQRAGQQDDTGIFEAAGELIQLIDKDDDGKSGQSTGILPLGMWRMEMAAQPWALMPGFVPHRVFAGSSAPQAKPVLARQGSGVGAIAVISLTGVISQHPDWFADTSLDGFTSDLMGAISDSTVGAILISIDSPGGSVYGVQEVSAMMMAARDQKPIVALANSLAASAAYWIGCSASEFYCTPGGEVGSIGVWQAHMDISGALDQAGVKTTLISAGKYKVEGNPYQPLDEDAQAFLQSRVDDYYDAFVATVTNARTVDAATVKNGMGQGRVLGAKAALQAQMIDGVMSLSQVLLSMQKGMAKKEQSSVKTASLVARHRLELMA